MTVWKRLHPAGQSVVSYAETYTMTARGLKPGRRSVYRPWIVGRSVYRQLR